MCDLENSPLKGCEDAVMEQNVAIMHAMDTRAQDEWSLSLQIITYLLNNEIIIIIMAHNKLYSGNLGLVSFCTFSFFKLFL